MKVGFTYDLREEYLARGFSPEEAAEFDVPETIDGIASALESLGHDVDRIGSARALLGALGAGRRWDLVFNIAEGLRGFGREALVPAILDEFAIPYVFSDPLVLALCLHKGLCKRVVRDLGVPTPDFAVVETSAEVAAVRLPFPLFAKPVAEGTGKGISSNSRIDDPVTLARVCDDLLGRFGQPVLVETFLPGREFTAGIVGTGLDARVVGIMEVAFRPAVAAVYSYDSKAHYEQRVDYALLREELLASDVARAALGAWRGLGCRDGGRVDLRLDAAGRPSFIEVNPLAGLNPIHSDLPILWRLGGGRFVDLVAAIVASAGDRIRDARPSAP
jgi:D-alanine-D-alanine ligase